jgi:hypothetical protein
MKTRFIPGLLLLAIVLICVAGTKLSQLPRTTTLSSNDLIMVVRTTNGRKTNFAQEIRYFGTNLGAWITNASSGSGEANVLGAGGTTNATKIDLNAGKSGVTLLTKTVQAGYGVLKTNEGTNIVTAIDPAVIPNHTQLGASSNDAIAAARGDLQNYSTNRHVLPSIYTNIVYVNATGATAIINGSLYTNALKNAPAASLLVMSKGTYDLPETPMPLIRNGIDQHWSSGSSLIIGRTNGAFQPIFSDENEVVVCNITGNLKLYASNETSIVFYLDRTGTKVTAEMDVAHVEGLAGDSSTIYLLGTGAPELNLTVRDYAKNNTYDLGYFEPNTGAKARVKISKAYFQGDAVELNSDAPAWGNVDIDIGYAEQNAGSAHQSYIQLAGRCKVRVGYLKVGGLTATMVFNGSTNGLLYDSIIESPENAQWSLIQPQVPSGKPTAGWLKGVTLIGGTNVDVMTLTNSAARPLVLENVTVKPGWGSTNWARGFTPAYIEASALTVADAKPIGSQITLLGTNWFSSIHNRGAMTNAGNAYFGGDIWLAGEITNKTGRPYIFLDGSIDAGIVMSRSDTLVSIDTSAPGNLLSTNLSGNTFTIWDGTSYDIITSPTGTTVYGNAVLKSNLTVAGSATMETNSVKALRFTGGTIPAGALLGTSSGTNATGIVVDTNGFILTTNGIFNGALMQGADGIEIWDDFNRSVTNSPGQAPSGHWWGHATAGSGAALSNYVYTSEGFFKVPTNSIQAAQYWGLSQNNTNSQITRYGGTFRFRQWPDPNGIIEGVTMIIGTNLSLAGNFLHCYFSPQGFYIEKSLTGSFLLSHDYPRGWLQMDALNSFEINIVGSNIVVRVNDHMWIANDSQIATQYTPAVGQAVLIVEHNHLQNGLVAQYYGEWGSVYAGPRDEAITAHFSRGGFQYGTNFNLISVVSSNVIAQNVHLNGGTAGSSILRTDSSTNLAAVTIGAGLNFDGATISYNGSFTPSQISGVGGANTNFTIVLPAPESVINGFTNVSLRAVMATDAAKAIYWSLLVTNGSGSDRTLEFSAVTNRWRFSGTYGTNAPSTLTNATQLLISGRSQGTNTVVGYTYFPWP